MSLTFNVDEILAMAERIEANGAAFYRKAAVTNPNGVALFLQIAKQEDEHLATFAAMREALRTTERAPDVFDPDGEAVLYMRAMADSHVFAEDTAIDEAIAAAGESELLRLAIGKEKDSIVFYSGLRDIVPASFGQARVDLIIREELRHIAWLSARARSVAAH